MKLCESRVFLDPKIYFAIMVQNNWSFRPKIIACTGILDTGLDILKRVCYKPLGK